MSNYCVTKQVQWPDGDMVVEVSIGDFNYCNPGAMGDIEEFEFAVEAAQRAIELQKKWQEHNPGEEVFVGHGYTGGHTMPFDPEEPEELLDWAKQRDDALPCCDQCGTKITDEKNTFRLPDEDAVFCQEYCAEQYQLENTPCLQCDELVGEKPYWMNEHLFCSEKCSDKYDDLHEDDDGED